MLIYSFLHLSLLLQIPSGTTEEKRTTVPFIYNMEARVEGLDIVDFPGVDDSDESISELADLLLTLAQIIIFVVDYRYPWFWLELYSHHKVCCCIQDLFRSCMIS